MRELSLKTLSEDGRELRFIKDAFKEKGTENLYDLIFEYKEDKDLWIFYIGKLKDDYLNFEIGASKKGTLKNAPKFKECYIDIHKGYKDI